MTVTTELAAPLPDIKVSVRQIFGFDSDMEVPAYPEPDDHVPDIDDYRFDPDDARDPRRLRAQSPRHGPGYHGTGKSTHIEQVAARLNWPCVRVNLDSHISRIDLDRQGRDRRQRRPAGDRVPGRHRAVGAAAPRRADASTNTMPAVPT